MHSIARWDTSEAAAAIQLAAWRAMSPAEKLAQVRALTGFVLRLEREGLRRRHPDLGTAALHQLAVARRLGPTLAARVVAGTARAD